MAAALDTGVPILFSKIYLKDGYCRMIVNEKDYFAYVLPMESANDDVYLVKPYSLQMGWSKSPTFFCAATETSRDVSKKYYKVIKCEEGMEVVWE